MDFVTDYPDKFVRTELLLGEAGMRKLAESTVAVFGIGGVGSFVVEGLARAGIGHLVLIDKDDICASNINRQLHATTKTVGQKKTEVMKARVLDIHPKAVVDTVDAFYSAENADAFFARHYDYVVDAIDIVAGKVSIVLECKRRKIPIICSMGAGNKLNPAMFEVADIYKTSVDPLARIMRKKLREYGVRDLKVVYSKEVPLPVGQEDCPIGERIVGSISFVPPVAGFILAGEVVRALLAGGETPENMLWDG